MKRRRLSKDEDALWRKATRDVRQLAPGQGGGGPLGINIGETSRETAFPTRADPVPTPPKGAPVWPASPSAFEAGDPAMERRARRGRVAVDRRLDLHGMTQVAAHVALVSFLQRANADRCRCVLVITGKGAGDERIPFGAPPGRGIIRRRFREWVDEDPLRSIIARVAPAAQKDGGAGAFYVFLKSGGRRF